MKFILFLAVFLCSAPGYANGYKPKLPMETISSSMSSAERKVREAAVKVVVPGGGHGSGSWVKYKDVFLVITAQHVVDKGRGTNYLIVKDNQNILATLIYSDSVNDISILYPLGSLPNVTPINYEPVKNYDIGTDIIYSGYPSGHKLMSFDGRIAGYEQSQQGATQLIVNTYGWFGCSGSVIYDTKGHIIGVLYGVDIEYYPNIQVNENLIWVAPIKALDMKEALKPFCRGTVRNYKACR